MLSHRHEEAFALLAMLRDSMHGYQNVIMICSSMLKGMYDKG